MGFFDEQYALQASDVITITASQRTAVEYQQCISIADESTWLYKNLKYPRFRNFYGYAQIMSGAFVVNAIALNFLNQEILHWRDETFGINETTGCYAKGLASVLTPPSTLVTNTVKTRQRFTSVRYRLLPGIVANVSVVYETAQAKCDGNVLEPDEKQGQPPLSNNSGASPNPRPASQNGDPFDGSNNDGNYNPGDGRPQPPSAGGGASSGRWKVLISAYDGADRAYTATIDLPSFNRFDTVTVATRPGPGGTNAGGKSDKVLTVTINGVTSDTTASGFGMNVFTPYFG